MIRFAIRFFLFSFLSGQVLAACGPYTIVFFMIVVFFGAFYLINLMLAVVAMSYDDEAGVTNQASGSSTRLQW